MNTVYASVGVCFPRCTAGFWDTSSAAVRSDMSTVPEPSLSMMSKAWLTRHECTHRNLHHHHHRQSKCTIRFCLSYGEGDFVCLTKGTLIKHIDAAWENKCQWWPTGGRKINQSINQSCNQPIHDQKRNQQFIMINRWSQNNKKTTWTTNNQFTNQVTNMNNAPK